MLKADVLVIGAGPAGSISASMLKKAGLDVVVVEREKFPRFVIGESLLPRCMEVLEDAGFLEAVRNKNFQEKFGAKFLKGEAVSDFNFSEQYSKGWNWTLFGAGWLGLGRNKSLREGPSTRRKKTGEAYRCAGAS